MKQKLQWIMMCAVLAAMVSVPSEFVFAEGDSTTESADVSSTEGSEDSEETTVYTSSDGNYTYTLSDEGTAIIYQYENFEEETVEIPSELDGYTVTELGSGAIVSHSEIVSLTLPETLETINDSCFFGCTSLETIAVEDGNEWFTVVDGVLFSADERYLICYPLGSDATSYTVPDTVVEIWSSAFAQSSLTSITLPEGLLYIDDWTFSYVPLESLELPDSLIEIGDDAFIYCTGLTEVTFPSSLETIGAEAFAACENLETITLNDGLLTVEQSALAGTAMTEVTIPSSVTTISFAAFGYEEDTVTAVDGFVIYGVSGSQAQTYCTDADEENDYENNFTFRTVMSEDVDGEETTIETETEEASIWQQYGKWILIGCAVLVLLVVGLLLLFSGRNQEEKSKKKSKKKTKQTAEEATTQEADATEDVETAVAEESAKDEEIDEEINEESSCD